MNLISVKMQCTHISICFRSLKFSYNFHVAFPGAVRIFVSRVFVLITPKFSGALIVPNANVRKIDRIEKNSYAPYSLKFFPS